MWICTYSFHTCSPHTILFPHFSPPKGREDIAKSSESTSTAQLPTTSNVEVYTLCTAIPFSITLAHMYSTYVSVCMKVHECLVPMNHMRTYCVCAGFITILAITHTHRVLDVLYVDIALLMCSIRNTEGFTEGSP